MMLKMLQLNHLTKNERRMKIKPFMQLMGAVVGLMWCVGGAYGGCFPD
jgi:hypothetical protein